MYKKKQGEHIQINIKQNVFFVYLMIVFEMKLFDMNYTKKMLSVQIFVDNKWITYIFQFQHSSVCDEVFYLGCSIHAFS